MRKAPRALVALVLALGLCAGGAWAKGSLSLLPARGTVGAQVTVTATGLPASTQVALVWHTMHVGWKLSQDASQLLGVDLTPTQSTLATATTDANGDATLAFTVPKGFGHLHNLTLVDKRQNVLAQQGFFVLPSVTVTPTSGPPGTPIHVTLTGIGYASYQNSYEILYDQGYTGIVTAFSTDGTAEVVLPASGAPGKHLIQIDNGHDFPYLNGAQAPTHIPGVANLSYTIFTVTDQAAVLPASASAQGIPRRAGSTATGPGPRLALSASSGAPGAPITVTGDGFAPGAKVDLSWSTVVGNRISGHGWQQQFSPLANATADASGHFSATVATPDDLGGAHAIVADAGQAKAQAEYAITPAIIAFGAATDTAATAEDQTPLTAQAAAVEFGTPSTRDGWPDVSPGQMLTLHLKGIGWTATENTTYLDVDNGYIGYACGFNTQGDVLIHLPAAVRPGWHFIDLYPAIYSGSAAPLKTDLVRKPMLNAADHPGEKLPVLHLAYYVH